ncbi:MAG: hypothetical protein L6Q37_09800 [Bdellovibrionaceae bacterium]|nr:hypothetical protein [Pseudobdellovibrionaceae bacterium]NUM57508.1 hypothetical protein [Pseudobdellovibrionaceae bacterium]
MKMNDLFNNISKVKSALAICFLLLSFAKAQNTNVPSNADYSQKHGIDNFSVLMSSKSIKFMKNPCFSEIASSADTNKARLSQIRGFGFSDGIVTLFKKDGTLGRSKYKYESLYEYLTKNKVCATKSDVKMTIDFDNLLIWN